MLSNIKRPMLEAGIKGVLAHRLAKRVVDKCKEMKINSDHKYFMYLFDQEADAFVLEARRVMSDYGVDEDTQGRLLNLVKPQAESEVVIFETRGEFSGHGADQCTLEVVIGRDLLKLVNQ